MAIADKVKVDLYGQYNNNTEHAYSYPDKITNQYSFTGNTAWAAAITDPRALFQSVCKSGPCYQVYRHRNGYYFSLIVRNQADSRSGLEMVTVFIPSGVYASGTSILATLLELKSLLIVKHDYNDQLVASCISNIRESHSKGWFTNKIQENPSGQSVSAYRTYRNESELVEIFTFLKQQEYSGIDKLLIVSESDVKEGTTVQHIGSPLRRLFNIVPTKNVSSDLSEVSVGERFKITFTKEDFESRQVEVVLDPYQPQYYRISGNDVFLFSPSELRISFNKRLYIRVEAEDGPSPDPHRVEAVFDGKMADKDASGRPFVHIPEDLIYPGSKAALQVSAPGFESYQCPVNLESLKNNQSVSVRLKPKKRLLNIRFRFGDPSKGETSFPSVELPFNETDPMLETVMVERNFFGYNTYLKGNGEYCVNIPWGHYYRNERVERRRKGMPRWLKIVLYSLLALFIAAALLLGGYAIRNYTSVKIPGLYTTQTVEAFVEQPSTPQKAPSDSMSVSVAPRESQSETQTENQQGGNIQ